MFITPRNVRLLNGLPGSLRVSGGQAQTGHPVRDAPGAQQPIWFPPLVFQIDRGPAGSTESSFREDSGPLAEMTSPARRFCRWPPDSVKSEGLRRAENFLAPGIEFRRDSQSMPRKHDS